MLNNFLLIFALIFLTGCQTVSNQTEDMSSDIPSYSQHNIEYTNQRFGYQIKFPSIITDSGSWLNGSTNESGIFFGSKIDRSVNPPFGLRQLSIEINELKIPCPRPSESFFDGAGDSAPLKETTIMEDSTETFTMIAKFPGYACSVDHCNDEKYGMTQFKGRYILCSEHAGKTVLIEVNQITDNPGLAEEIFRTFRWVD